MEKPPVVAPAIRRRTPDDVPLLAAVLAEQRDETQYPVMWPLDVSVESFLVRRGELAAWVAELDGRVVGHVAVGVPGDELAQLWAPATGGSALGEVCVLFVGAATRGTGVGGLLLDTAVAWILDRGLAPVLDVAEVNDRALAVYRHRGWQEVARTRLSWLPEESGDLVLMTLPPHALPRAAVTRPNGAPRLT
jgi:GNAT superfamily N-acetyltransferase